MDYSGILERIALAAENIANTPNYWWISLIAVVIGGGIGYLASQRSIKKQNETNQAKKKNFVFNLLQKEIDLRWTEDIKPRIEEATAFEGLKRLRRFSTMQLSDSDVFIFREISLSFQEYYFLENTVLVSNIVHGYLLYKDMIDFNRAVNRFLNDYDKRKEALTGTLTDGEVEIKLNDESSKSIDDLAKSLPRRIKDINERFLSIKPDITS